MMRLDFRRLLLSSVYGCIIAVVAAWVGYMLGGQYSLMAIIGGAVYGLTVAFVVEGGGRPRTPTARG